MKNKCIIIFVTIIALMLNLLPVMSSPFTGELVSGKVVISGFNLLEFSALGCMPILAIILLPIIFFSNHSAEFQKIELILLAIITIPAYIHSLNAAREWLYSTSEAMITYHPGMIAYPFSFLLIIIVSNFLSTTSNSFSMDEFSF